MGIELLSKLLNSSIDQSDITSLIVNDVYGGKIMCCTKDGKHYFNIVGNEYIDLSSNGKIDYKDSFEVARGELLSNEDIKERYIKLLDKARSDIIDINIDNLFKEKRLYDYFDYINVYYNFCNYEIDNYSLNDNIEHVRVELAFVNTGLFIEVDYNIDTDEYNYEVDSVGDPLVLPREFFDVVFDYARKHKDNINFEEKLTYSLVNVRK